MHIGGYRSKKHVIWHGVNNMKMEMGVQPHIGTALSHWQSAFWVYWAGDLVGRKPDWTLWRREKNSVREQIKYPHLPVLWCHIMIICDASSAWNRTRTRADLPQTSCELQSHSLCINVCRAQVTVIWSVCVCVCVCVYRLEAALCEGGRQAVDLLEVVTN